MKLGGNLFCEGRVALRIHIIRIWLPSLPMSELTLPQFTDKVDSFNRTLHCALRMPFLVPPFTLLPIGLDEHSELRVEATVLPQFFTQRLNCSLIGFGGL